MSITTCSADGLSGFPVQPGDTWKNLPDKTIVPNDIQIQFSPSQTPFTWQSGNTGLLTRAGDQSSFFMSGTQFQLVGIQFCQPKQEGLTKNQSSIYGELRFWGLPSANSVSPSFSLAVLIIPVLITTKLNFVGESILNALTGNAVILENCIPSGEEIEVVRYVTCVEIDDNTTKTIGVAYWSSGATITNTDRQGRSQLAGLSSLPDPGIPTGMGFNYKFLTSSSGIDSSGKKTGAIFTVSNRGINQVYSTSEIESTKIKSTFRVIQGFTLRRKAPNKVDQYKCIAIDRGRDIRNGMLLVDPKTGRRMDQELKEAEDQQKEASMVEAPEISTSSILKTFFTGVGILLGITGIFGVVYLLITKFFGNKDGMMPPTPATATAPGTAPKISNP